MSRPLGHDFKLWSGGVTSDQYSPFFTLWNDLPTAPCFQPDETAFSANLAAKRDLGTSIIGRTRLGRLLSSRIDRRRVVVDLGGGAVVEGLMGPLVVVEGEPSFEVRSHLADAAV